MTSAAFAHTTFPTITCRPADVERIRFDGARWQAIRIDGRLHLREDELEDMLDGAIDAETWLEQLRHDELVWVDTGRDERTFVRLDGALRVARGRALLRGSAHERFLAWASQQATPVEPTRRRDGHLSVIDGGHDR